VERHLPDCAQGCNGRSSSSNLYLTLPLAQPAYELFPPIWHFLLPNFIIGSIFYLIMEIAYYEYLVLQLLLCSS